MRKYLYFISADASHLQRRLNRLASRGFELTDVEGLFSGRFEKSERSDLHYLTVPYGGAKNFPRGSDFSPFGWELAGGFNGVAIFKSLPCVQADADGLLTKLESDGCVHRDRLTVPLTAAVLCALAVALFAVPWSVYQTPFWSSYAALVARLLRWLFAVLAVVNLAALPRTAFSAWVHGLTIPIVIAAVLLGVLTALLDVSNHTVYFLIIPLLLAAACLASLWWRSRWLGCVVAVVCLLFLCAGLIFPNEDQAVMAGKSLRNAVSDQSVLTLEELGINDSLSGTGYTKDGTFLVRRTSYWEMSEEASVSGDVYLCLTGGLCNTVTERLLKTGGWTETENGWVSADGRTIVLQRGRYVAKVSCSAGLETALWENAAAVF